jgi:hypothetical protein
LLAGKTPVAITVLCTALPFGVILLVSRGRETECTRLADKALGAADGLKRCQRGIRLAWAGARIRNSNRGLSSGEPSGPCVTDFSG